MYVEDIGFCEQCLKEQAVSMRENEQILQIPPFFLHDTQISENAHIAASAELKGYVGVRLMCGASVVVAL